MMSPYSPRWFGRSLLAAVAPLALACSGAPSAGHGTAGGGTSAAQSGAGTATPKSAQGAMVLATYQTTYDAKTNQLTTTTLSASERLAGDDPTISDTSPAGRVNTEYGLVTRGAQSLQISNGANSGANASCGDTTQGIAVAAGRFCTAATLTNNSLTKTFNFVFVELNSITAGVSLVESQTGTDTLTQQALQNTINESIGALNYGNIAPQASSTREWVFNVPNASNFTFTWSLLGGPTHATYSTGFSRPTFTDACALGGKQQLFPSDWFDVVQNQPLDFPITIFNVTGTVFSMTANGVLSLDPLFEPSGPDTTNVALPASGESNGTVFPFWTSQVPRAGSLDGTGGTDLAGSAASATDGQACSITQGTAPNRTFAVTWQNMRLCTDPGTCGGANTDYNTLFSYTVIFAETTDTIEFEWNVMNDAASWTTDPPTIANETLTTRSRGNTATIGFQGTTSGTQCNGAACVLQLGFDTAYLPSPRAAYTRGVTFTPGAT